VFAKAAEVRGLLPFFVHLVREFQFDICGTNGPVLLEAMESLEEFVSTFMQASRSLRPSVQARLLELYLKYVSCLSRVGCPLIPKHHLVMHMVQRSATLGNFRFYWCYWDEGINGFIAHIAKSAHRTTFALTCYYKFKRKVFGK
jgi:hypothetical protein